MAHTGVVSTLRECACWVASVIWLFPTPWTVAHQAPLSMGFSRQKYWSGLPCPSPEDLPDQGLSLQLLLCRQALYKWAIREAQFVPCLPEYGRMSQNEWKPSRDIPDDKKKWLRMRHGLVEGCLQDNWPMCNFASATMIEHHRLGSLNNRNIFSQNSGV